MRTDRDFLIRNEQSFHCAARNGQPFTIEVTRHFYVQPKIAKLVSSPQLKRLGLSDRSGYDVETFAPSEIASSPDHTYPCLRGLCHVILDCV